MQISTEKRNQGSKIFGIFALKMTKSKSDMLTFLNRNMNLLSHLWAFSETVHLHVVLQPFSAANQEPGLNSGHKLTCCALCCVLRFAQHCEEKKTVVVQYKPLKITSFRVQSHRCCVESERAITFRPQTYLKVTFISSILRRF